MVRGKEEKERKEGREECEDVNGAQTASLISLYSIEAYLLSNSIFGQQYNNYYCLVSQSSNLLLQPNMDPVHVCVYLC